MKEKFILHYDPIKFIPKFVRPKDTLQLFITNRCNLRCKACFNQHNLGRGDMCIRAYKDFVNMYTWQIDKIILMGGEPTLHPDIQEMIRYNKFIGKRTTVYTNGVNMLAFENMDLHGVEIRIGVYGASTSEKPLDRVQRVNFPVTIVFMIRRDNIEELPKVARLAEEFNCDNFYISSIRDIAQTQDYWIDNEDTVPLEEYYRIVQDFVNSYDGRMNLHIAKRGVIKLEDELNSNTVHTCRFGNIFIDGKKIMCPFDISKEIYTDVLQFGKRPCNKNESCILTKIVLNRR